MPVAYMVPAHHLSNVLKLAIGNGVRTSDEQELLLELARMVRSECEPFWPIVEEVRASWAASPCKRCDLPAEAGHSLCSECLPHRESFTVEERADALMGLVQQ